MTESFEVSSPAGGVLRGDLSLPDSAYGPLPVVIFCHGFKGFKDWGGWPYMAEMLAESGLAVVTFNFSHNGVGENPMEFSELDRFKDNTYTKEMLDLEALLAAIRGGEIPRTDEMDVSRIGLVAHSRGGVSAFGVAGKDSGVKAVAALASVSSALRASEAEQAKWREDGVVYIKNARTGQDMPLGLTLLDDMLEHKDLLQHSVASLDYPVLIVQGTADLAVTVEDAEKIAGWAKHPELKILENATHTFGIKHPFDGTSQDFEIAISMMQIYFSRLLS